MRLKLFLAGLLVLCMIGAVGYLHRGDSSAQAVPADSGPGTPAIRPTLASGSVRYTKADVEAYIKAHPAPPRMTLALGTTSTILTIDFVTSKEASQRMQGEWVGLPDTSMVCYVQIKGTFLLSHLSSPRGAKPFAPSNTATEVFDAQTGNLLVAGIP